MDIQSSDIKAKQQEMYRAMLSAFIAESRQVIEKEKQLYQQYIGRNFAKLKATNSGGYQLSQNGRESLVIHPVSTLSSRSIKLR